MMMSLIIITKSFFPVIVVTVSKFYVLTFDNANKLKAINFNFVGTWPYQNQKCFELGKCGCGMFYIPEANNDFIKSKLLNGQKMIIAKVTKCYVEQLQVKVVTH